MKIGSIILGVVIVLTLLLWNVYLVNENKNIHTEKKTMELKFNVMQGELDLLKYDLISSRDSVRILLKNMDSVPVIQRKF